MKLKSIFIAILISVLCNFWIIGYFLIQSRDYNPLFLVIGILIILSSFITVLFAEKIHTERKKKIFLLAFSLVILDCLIFAFYIVFLDSKNHRSLFQIVLDSIYLGIVGSILFSFITVPITIFAVLLIEKFTRKNSI